MKLDGVKFGHTFKAFFACVNVVFFCDFEYDEQAAPPSEDNAWFAFFFQTLW